MQITLDLCISRGALFLPAHSGLPLEIREGRVRISGHFSPDTSGAVLPLPLFPCLSAQIPPAVRFPPRASAKTGKPFPGFHRKPAPETDSAHPPYQPEENSSPPCLRRRSAAFRYEKAGTAFHGHLAVQPVFSRHNIGHPCFPILSLKVLSFLYFPIQSQRLLAAAPEKEVVVNLSASLRVQIRAVHGNRAAHDGIFRGNTDSVAQF